MYEKQLQQIGLTEGESKVYETLLRIGSTTVGPVVKKSGVAYSNIYEILNRLSGKGLVSTVTKEKTKYFQAVEPNRISDFLMEKENKIQKSKKIFDDLLPKLTKLENDTGNREQTEIFIGEKGLRTAYERLLQGAKKNDRAFFFSVHDEKYYEMSNKFYIRLWPYVEKFNVIFDGISNKEFKKTKLISKYPKFINQKYVDFPVPGNIDIFNNRVLIVTWQDKPIGILIESKEVATNFKQYFNSVWKIAKK